MTTTMTRKATKQVKVLNRYELKDPKTRTFNGIVVYEVRSSKGDATYKTTIAYGKASSCTCPATKPCYHMTQLEAREQERVALEQKINRDLQAQIEDDIRVNRIVDGKLVSCYWNELPEEERRAAYCSDFGIY